MFCSVKIVKLMCIFIFNICLSLKAGMPSGIWMPPELKAQYYILINPRKRVQVP